MAGLTDNVSSSPVNQSLTLIVGVNLVFLAAGTICLVHRFFRTWHNLLFGFTSGGIFVCTTTINCFIFVPQVCCHLCPVTWLETGTFSEFSNISCVGQCTLFPAFFPKCLDSPLQLILQSPPHPGGSASPSKFPESQRITELFVLEGT